jgi:hypothetical protein
VGPVSKRKRIVAVGSSGLLITAGVVCAVVIGGGTGETFALVLIGLGLVEMTSVVFLEVGLSEDRERDRAGKRGQAREPDSPIRSDRSPQARGRPDRMRSHRRRIR